MNPGPETGLKARKFGFKARTKYGVYSGQEKKSKIQIQKKRYIHKKKIRKKIQYIIFLLKLEKKILIK